MLEQGRPKILIVDDEEHITEVFSAALENLDYEVRVANSAAEASNVLSQYEPDLVLLDIRMPGKSGMELLREVKERYPNTGVIMVTAVDDTKTAVEAMRLGAYDYMLKPVSLPELELRVQKALERRALELGRQEYEKKLENEVRTRTEELSRRINELEALNKMFQQHLNIRFETEERFHKLIKAVEEFIQAIQPIIAESKKGNSEEAP